MVVATSGGDDLIDGLDTWLVLDDGEDGAGTPTIGLVTQGTDRTLSVTWGGLDSVGSGRVDQCTWEFSAVFIPRGQRVAVVSFVIQAASRAAAQAQAALLDDVADWPAEAWTGLEPTDFVYNFEEAWTVRETPLAFGVRRNGALIAEDVTEEGAVGLRLATAADDYIAVGRPFDLWSVEAAGIDPLVNDTDYAPRYDIPMRPVAVDLDPTDYSIEIEGEASGLGVSQLLGYSSGDSFLEIQTTVTAMTGAAVTGLMLLRGVDPDQDAFHSGLYATANDVVDVRRGALVVAEGAEATIALATLAPGAVGSVETPWPVEPASVVDSPVDPDGATADSSINLGFDLGDLSDGESVAVTYWYIAAETLASALAEAEGLGLTVADLHRPRRRRLHLADRLRRRRPGEKPRRGRDLQRP